MIPMSCPNCGRRGTVPPDRLNTRMHCKKCDAVFHMDASGKIMLGEPGGKKAKQPKKTAQGKDEPTDYIGLLVSNKAFQAVVALALVGVVGYFAVGGLMRVISGNVPRDPTRLTEYVGNKFADDALSAIQAVTSSATRDDIDQWYALAHPKLRFTGPQAPGNMCIVSVSPMSEDAEKAHLVVTIMPPDTGAPPPDAKEGSKPAGPQVMGLDLFWINEGGSWRLNGTETLRAAKEADAKEKEAAKKAKK